jgi:rubrerythrin
MADAHTEVTRAIVYWSERAHLHLRELCDVVRMAAAAEVRAIEAQGRLAALTEAPDGAGVLRARLGLKEREVELLEQRLRDMDAACEQHKRRADAAEAELAPLKAQAGPPMRDVALRASSLEATCAQLERRAQAAEAERAQLLAALKATSLAEGLARARGKAPEKQPEPRGAIPKVLRKPSAPPSQHVAQCTVCGVSFAAPHTGKATGACPVCKVAGRKKGDLACRTCAAGLPNPGSDVGYECLAFKARECVPVAFAYWHTPDEAST